MVERMVERLGRVSISDCGCGWLSGSHSIRFYAVYVVIVLPARVSPGTR